MQGMFVVVRIALLMCFVVVLVQCEYHKRGKHYYMHQQEQITHLHFYLRDIMGGDNATAILVAKANHIVGNAPTPFGNVYTIEDALTEGPEPTSKVIGNAQGLWGSTGRDELSLIMLVDFGFTTGKFNGSSFSVVSRNPVMTGDRELSVVGGRGQFRMTRGFAQLKTIYLNPNNGDAIIEYNVTLFHYLG